MADRGRDPARHEIKMAREDNKTINSFLFLILAKYLLVCFQLTCILLLKNYKFVSKKYIYLTFGYQSNKII